MTYKTGKGPNQIIAILLKNYKKIALNYYFRKKK